MVYPFILNGVITLYASVIGGYAFAKAIKKTPEREVAWRVVHSGGSMAGIMLMVFGCAWKYIALGAYETALGWSLIVSTQLLIMGMFLAAITGKRGLNSDSKGIEKIIFLLYAIGGAVCTVALTGILIGLILQ
jgi:hypothetical protein